MMKQVSRFICTADTTTMQQEPIGFRFSYAEASEDNTTEEKMTLPWNVSFLQIRNAPWHEVPVWVFGYVTETPLTTRDIAHSDPAHMDEASRQATTGKEDIWTIMPQREPVKASAEAISRLRGYEDFMERIYAIIFDEAQREHLLIHTLQVRVAWSHEYDDDTGVVIDVEIQGSAEQRFTLWDRVGVRIEGLETSLRPDERDFLTHRLSIIVNRR